jgi:tRNA-specific 2-thiouridylase
MAGYAYSGQRMRPRINPASACLDQEKLGRALFPVGDHPKPEIRQIAASFGLPTASRKDSQDLCFLAGDDYRNFLQRNAAEMLHPGEIVTAEGRVLGMHGGLANYTIGQRKGLGLAHPCRTMSCEGGREQAHCGQHDQLGRSPAAERHQLGERPGSASPFRAEVKIRYTARPAWAEVTSWSWLRCWYPV